MTFRNVIFDVLLGYSKAAEQCTGNSCDEHKCQVYLDRKSNKVKRIIRSKVFTSTGVKEVGFLV